MFNPTVRIILCALGLLMAWISYSIAFMEGMYLVLAAVGLLIWGYFNDGTVYIACQQLKRENYEKAEKLLSKIKNPDHLQKSQKSYYHFTKGFIELNKQNLAESFNQFTAALELGLRTENDTSIVTLTLASIELERKNFDEARKYLIKTKDIKHKPELKPEIERIETELNAAQQEQ